MSGDSLLKAGTVLNLRYRIEKVLKEQEDTVTYLAFDSKKEINVIVKEFSPMDWGEDRRLFELGKRDFMKMAGKIAINSGKRGMVSVTDWFLENETAYAVEDYIDGIPLMNYVAFKRNLGSLSLENIKFFMEDVFKALRAVHKTGIIHGNISPENILIQENGEAKVIGFSLISPGVKKQAYKFLGYKDGAFPVDNPGYAAPEQYQMENEWGYGCDVYGISGVLYYCVTGKVPPESASRIKKDTLLSQDMKKDKIPEQEKKVILKGLELDRKYRYPDMEIMYNEFYNTTKEQEEDNDFGELERKLHFQQDKEIFGDIDWQQESNLDDIEKNLNIGIEQGVSQVRKEKRQADLKKSIAAKESSQNSKSPEKNPRKKGKHTIILIILAMLLIAVAVAALMAIINSSLFDDKAGEKKEAEETAAPEPTPGLTSEVYEIKAKDVYKVYRNADTDYAVLVLSFTNNSDEAVSLNDIYEVSMQENGTNLERAESFKSEKFRSGREKKAIEPGETRQVNLVFYLLDKEINRISVIFTSITGSGTRVEKRMKLSRKYYDMELKVKDSDEDKNNSEDLEEDGTDLESESGTDEEKVHFDYTSASSSLADDTGSGGRLYTYTPDNLIDGDLTTCWSEGQTGDGLGAYVKLSADTNQKVRGMYFYNGNEESAYWFEKNSCVSEISIEFSDGTVINKKVDTELAKQPVNIDFGREIDTNYIKITITGARVPAGAYTDTSISEIEVY